VVFNLFEYADNLKIFLVERNTHVIYLSLQIIKQLFQGPLTGSPKIPKDSQAIRKK